MSARIPPGMDNPYYPFSPIDRRPTLHWPKGRRIAFWLLLTIEHWELQAPPGSHKDPRFVGEYGTYDPDYRTWTQREYGNRVGIFRVLEALDRHGIKATVALNSAAARRYPNLVEACRARGYEFIGHGSHASRMLTSRMSEDEERAIIRDALDTLGRTTGKRPRGWHGQEYGESQRTPRLLAEAGLDFVADWPNDDQPYAMTLDRPFVSLPSQPEWDDVQLLWLRRVGTPRFPEIVGEAFDGLYDEGGRVFCLAVHPWLMGMAHRIRYLDAALKRVMAKPKVWQATASEIVDAFNAARARPG
jgi:peptidoglycan/xylan/chitin deacetylase (PgdA/CDA1 family)